MSAPSDEKTGAAPSWIAATSTIRVSQDAGRLSAIDSALSPSGMLSDLSRIVAEYARPLPKWDANCPDAKSGAVVLDEERLSVRCADDLWAWKWVISDCPLREFPSPVRAAAAQERVWSVRVEDGQLAMCCGVARPSTAPSYNAGTDAHSWNISTHSPYGWKGSADQRALGIPYTGIASATGSVYHFTADLATGDVRVRPVVKSLSQWYKPSDPLQTEWTIVSGVKGLAEYWPFVAMRQPPIACSLLHAPREEPK